MYRVYISSSQERWDISSHISPYTIHYLDIYININTVSISTWKTIIMFFVERPWPFLLSLRLWSSGATCVRVAMFFYCLFNSMSKKYGFATGRTAMFLWFDNSFFFKKNRFYKKKNDRCVYFFHNHKNMLCFFGFPGIYIYIYIL